MSNAFSSPEFLAAAAEAMFPGKKWSREIVEVDGQRFGLLAIEGRLVPILPYFDFWEPLTTGEAPSRRVKYLPSVALDRVDVGVWRDGANDDLRASPLVEWSRFPTFADFKEYARGRHWQAFEKSARKVKKLTRELGELRFVPSAPTDEHLAACMHWKSAQYRATGLVDALESPRQQRLFFNLRDRGSLQVSALYAGDRLVAVHMNALENGRLYYWIPAHDPELSRYSVGVLLLERVMEASYTSGHREFDFLVGAEEYKFRYATHVRRIGNRGVQPLWRRMWRPVRSRIVEQTSKHPVVHSRLQAMKREILRRSLR